MADWTREQDRHLLPYLHRDLPRDAKARIAAAVGRTDKAVKQRIVELRRRARAGLPLENHSQRATSRISTVRPGALRGGQATQMVTRKCCMCGVSFAQDRARSNFFRCAPHRYANDAAWLGDGGTGGRVRHVR